jgi:hypothetical protein
MLGDLRVRATAALSERLLAWAGRWPQRIWAVENVDHLYMYELRTLRGQKPGVLADSEDGDSAVCSPGWPIDTDTKLCRHARTATRASLGVR